jgi:putative phage-type endonuclease
MVLTAEQLELRRRGIGSSDIAAVCNEDPFKGLVSIWLSKVEGLDEPVNDQMDLGHEVETILADRFAHNHNITLEKCTTQVSDREPWILATPDRRIVGANELVECKNVGYRMQHRWRVDRDVYRAPSYVVIQTQWQMLVTGAEACWVVALLGGRDFHEERIDFDPDLAETLVAIGADFWINYVERGVMPPMDGTEVARRLVEKLYPNGSGRMKATPEIERLAREYAEARAREKAAAEEKERIGTLLRAEVGEYAECFGEFGKVTLKNIKGHVDWPGLAKTKGVADAEIERFRKPGGRQLRVSVIGAAED